MLYLQREHLQTIANEALAAKPFEVCGLLVGQDQTVVQVISIPNSAHQPQHQFYMDEQSLLRALRRIDQTNLKLLGIYHSHGSSDPIPSPTDIAAMRANYPQLTQLIISLKYEKPCWQGWKIDIDRVTPIDIVVSAAKPQSEEFSTSQIYAILLIASLALLVMLTVAASLLPPAPVITPMPN